MALYCDICGKLIKREERDHTFTTVVREPRVLADACSRECVEAFMGGAELRVAASTAGEKKQREQEDR